MIDDFYLREVLRECAKEVRKNEKEFNSKWELFKEYYEQDTVCSDGDYILIRILALSMHKYYNKWKYTRRYYNMLVKDFRLNDKIYCNNRIMPKGEKMVIEAINILRNKYKILNFYLFKWPHIKNINTLEFDFYCILLHNNSVYEFVIEYDEEHHNKKYYCSDPYQNDLLKQREIAKMGISMIRLKKNKFNDVEKIKNELETFILDIIENLYVTKHLFVHSEIINNFRDPVYRQELRNICTIK